MLRFQGLRRRGDAPLPADDPDWGALRAAPKPWGALRIIEGPCGDERMTEPDPGL
jgi:hypothetical protein